MAQFVTAAAFNQPEPARELAQLLLDAGVNAEFSDESLAQKLRFFQTHPRAQFRVRVGSQQLAPALRLMKMRAQNFPPLQLALHCPECGSTQVEYPQFSRRTLMGALPALAAAIGLIESDFYCTSCHFTWPAKVPPPAPPSDTLNWPIHETQTKTKTGT